MAHLDSKLPAQHTVEEYDTDDVQRKADASHYQNEHRILYFCVTSARFYDIGSVVP
jgi:hypothetical protein